MRERLKTLSPLLQPLVVVVLLVTGCGDSRHVIVEKAGEKITHSLPRAAEDEAGDAFKRAIKSGATETQARRAARDAALRAFKDGSAQISDEDVRRELKSTASEGARADEESGETIREVRECLQECLSEAAVEKAARAARGGHEDDNEESPGCPCSTKK